MIFRYNRLELRKLYFDSWQKHLVNQKLTDLETQIIHVIKQHPEYHHYLSNIDNLEKDFSPDMHETNPFLHLGLHLGIIEQIVTNRPDGIQGIYHNLCQKNYDTHKVQHVMMDYLAESIWNAQKNNAPPCQKSYIDQLKSLLLA